MKLHIREFAKLTGVSVRTLHFYDEIGLLKPSSVDEQNGYHFYDEYALIRMQEILFYRELDFPLKEIRMILSSPDYDKQNALKEQKHLLTLKKERLERLISALDGAMEGEIVNMNVFDNSEFEAKCEEYAKEAKKKWGDTAAYKESAENTADYSAEKWKQVNSAMEERIAEFADCKRKGFAPISTEAQALVKKWQNFITENYYTCTKLIIAELGEMYVADERFCKNIDRHGDGTAQFMSDAIKAYCK
ncbi:MerR family transcriptional regulator [Ruminococcus sp.]|uniref:MerR family transcriptional regulator n=1 Tax=Ruminococcus sp. TaxID=41978 RepID=UPI002622A283|nr:MerR family transcriptional regulator [Ruminococcus sp.]MDD6987937.1 MerR family transcriptional regulator [Ruminococcus sp.]MDY6201498.1 MerR family transcriptional regulator [Ruminococcus sp.]